MQLAVVSQTFAATIVTFEVTSNWNVANELPKNTTLSMPTVIAIRSLDVVKGEATIAVVDVATTMGMVDTMIRTTTV
jgi:hypothetical protein